MDQMKPLPVSTFLAPMILLSGICGWFVPAFYDWTGADQSRPSPLMWQVPLMVAIGASLFSVMLIWIPIAGSNKTAATVLLQFKVRSVLLLMACVAVTIAIGMRAPVAVSAVYLLLAVGAAIWLAFFYPHRRLPVAALFGCMFLPYVWILGYEQLSNLMPIIFWMSSGMPGVFTIALVAHLSGTSPQELVWPSIFVTAVQIAIGLWLIRVGPKPTIVYILFVMLSSLMGSLILNALLRA